MNTSPKESKSLAILLADDVRDLRALIATWLEESGHTVTCASNGQEVVRFAAAQEFDVVITDILMPDGDGWDAIAKVHRLRPGAAIVAISGGTREIPANAALRVARKAGAIELLQKPFSRPDLLETIRRVTKSRRP